MNGGRVCLNDNGSSAKAGTAITVAACNGSAAQLWQFPSSGTLKVFSMCLTDPGNSTTTGTRVTVAKCTAAASQKWTRQ